VKLGFDEFDYGFVYRRVLENTDETNEWWTVGRVCLWPNALFTTNHFEWRVPIDDDRTLSVTWYFSRVPNENEPYVQERIPYWYGPVREPLTGRWITSHVMNQDFVAWLGQGTIADRTREHLGGSDRGVIMIRKRLLDDLAAIERGEDPKAVIRDPDANVCLRLPITQREFYERGLTRAEMDDPSHYKIARSTGDYNLQAGQPADVRAAYEAAMRVPASERP
jgi:5,5'-dehydrodivanillate O-demethylase